MKLLKIYSITSKYFISGLTNLEELKEVRAIKFYIVIFLCFISSSALPWIAQTRFYELLEVKPSASMTEIRKAYLEKAKQSHPDKFHAKSQKEQDTATKTFQMYKEIYEILSSPPLREKYDNGELSESNYFEKWEIYSGTQKVSPDFRTTYNPTQKRRAPDSLFLKVSLHMIEDGKFHINIGDYEDAIKSLTKAIERIETDLAYFTRGFAYARLNQHERAIEDFDNAVRINPKDNRYYLNRGISYAALQMYDEAIASFNTAIDPLFYLPYAERGLVHYTLGLYEIAEADLETFFYRHKSNGGKKDSSTAYYKNVLKLSKQKLREQKGQLTFLKRCASFFRIGN